MLKQRWTIAASTTRHEEDLEFEAEPSESSERSAVSVEGIRSLLICSSVPSTTSHSVREERTMVVEELTVIEELLGHEFGC